MKIALIIPKNESAQGKSFYDIKFVTKFTFSRRYFSYLLAIPTLVSLTPEEHEIRIFDENIEDIDYSWKADLAGISVRTMFAPRAYEISLNYKKLGTKTVLGGIHPSVCPEESLKYSDAVVVGEAEEVWLSLLGDLKSGNLKPIYKAEGKADLTIYPEVTRDGLKKEKYFADIVQTTKGCPFSCEFCSVYYFDGQKIRNRPIKKIISEIEKLSGTNNNNQIKFKKKSIFFADDNIISNKKYALELFSALKPYKLNWSCQASINISQEDEILRLMKDAGCGSILIGLETVSSDNLSQMGKGINLKHDYLKSIEKIQSFGILVHASFILGSDFDTQLTIRELVDFIKKSKLLMPLINILTPFPGTKLFERLEKEGRIMHKKWDLFDAKNVVFFPKKMTPEELKEAYRFALRDLYSFDNIYKNLTYYWNINFWKHSNEIDPIPFKYRILFAIRLFSYIGFKNIERTKFILKIVPKIFNPKVRLSTILTLMSYNDFAYSLEKG